MCIRDRTSNDHVTLYSISNAKNTIKLCNVSRLCMEIDKGVITVSQTIDFISELALTPIVYVIYNTVTFSEGGFDTFHNCDTGFFVD